MGVKKFLTEGFTLDSYSDDAYGFLGTEFSKIFIYGGSEKSCFCKISLFTSNQNKLSDVFGDEPPLNRFQEFLKVIKDNKFSHRVLEKERDQLVSDRVAVLKKMIRSCKNK